MKEEESSPITAKKPAYWKIGGIAIIVIVALSIVFFLLFRTPKIDEIPHQNNTVKASETVIEPTQPNPILSDKECGDGICGLKEDYSVCKTDCIASCGDEVIQDNENWKNCRLDLMRLCGDGKCDSWEHYRYCPEDCAECIVDDRGTYTGPNKCPPSPRWA